MNEYICPVQKLYKFITYLFFPGTMAILGFLLPLLIWPPFHLPYHFWLVMVFCFVLFPVVGILIFIKFKLLKDIHVYDRKLRTRTYPLAIVGSGLALIYLKTGINLKMAYFEFALSWVIAINISLILIWIVNHFLLKASAHMCGVGGFLAAAICLTLWGWSAETYVVNSVIIAGLVYLSRLGLSAHSHIELLSGFGLGFITTFAVLCL